MRPPRHHSGTRRPLDRPRPTQSINDQIGVFGLQIDQYQGLRIGQEHFPQAIHRGHPATGKPLGIGLGLDP